MTALGKTLTIFVFLLSLAWCWLTVNAYVTRSNWQTQSAGYKKAAEDSAKRANELKKAHDDAIATAEGQLATLAKEIESLKQMNTTLVLANAKLDENFKQLNLDNKKAEDNKVILENNLKATNNQLDASKARADDIENKYVVAQRSEQDAKNFALAQKLDSDAFKNRNETLEQLLLQLQSTLNDMRLGRTGLGAATLVPVPSDIRGSVSAVASELITISLGADAGILKGAEVHVSRGNSFVGTLRIVEIEPKRSVGVFSPAGGGRISANNLPIVGDTISKIKN